MDELQSVGLGLALGVVLVTALSFYPGEPFDYSISDDSDCVDTDVGHTSTLRPDAHTPTRCASVAAATSTAAADCCASTMPFSTRTGGTPSKRIGHDSTRMYKDERATQARKIRKLQTLLDIERDNITRDDATSSTRTTSSNRASTTKVSFGKTATYSSRVDAVVYTLAIALLALVLKREYGVDVVQAAARCFPREIETAQRVFATPWQLLEHLWRLLVVVGQVGTGH